MLVPQYWAEAKEKKIIDGRQVTIKRFGWSDESQQSAQKHAQVRVSEAFSLRQSGEKIRRTEPKVPYNGAEGVPIREEIVSRHRDSVITRNSYGALCINTPDVLFADIDTNKEPSSKLYLAAFFIYLACVIVASTYIKSWLLFFALLFLSIGVVPMLGHMLFNLVHLMLGNEEHLALQRIRDFSKHHPDWHLRVYRSPNGYRVLVIHKTFDPHEEDAQMLLQELRSDPIYVRMCKNQNCFRARVSPKPWRIEIERLKPRPGVWPIKAERMSERSDWVKKYELAAINYASCRFLEKLGSDQVDSKADFIRSLHDKYSRSDTDLEIA